MPCMNDSKHLFLAEELVVVLFSLRIETRVVVGIEALRSRCAAIERFVEAPDTAAAGIPIPGVVTLLGRGIAITNQALAARFLGCQNRIQTEQPQTAGLFEIGIYRQRLYFRASDQVVAGVVADLNV